jgi:hypothetical protein
MRHGQRLTLALAIRKVRDRLAETPNLTAIALGIASALSFQVMLDYTPLYRTRIRLDLATRPHLELGDDRMVGAEQVMPFDVDVRVENRGLRPGRLTHVEVTPGGTQPIPKIDIIEIDRGLLWPWRPRTIRIRGLLHVTAQTIGFDNQWQINLFDDSGELVFSLRWHLSTESHFHGKILR